jgi:two-component system invasion response regulator UvrY
MIRVLLCDDHRIVREGLKQILADTNDIEVAGECADGPEACRQAAILAIDLVLLDIALPVRDGLDVLRQLKQDLPRLPVLMLSTYPEKQYAERCFRLGAAGYLNKSVRDIAVQLELSPTTVSTYRSRILEKTGALNDVGIALYGVNNDLLGP